MGLFDRTTGSDPATPRSDSLGQRPISRRLFTAVAATALACGSVAAGTSGAAAAPPVHLAPMVSTDSATAIPDRYIVVFNRTSRGADVNRAKDEARANGATVHYEYDAALTGFAATMPAKAVENLRRNPNVQYIEADQTVSATVTQTGATWGIDRIDQRNRPLSGTYTYNYTGSGVRAYIVDTGILASHSQFGGRVLSGYTAINDGRGTTDCNGHGTHVAGTVGGSTYGVAKSVTLVAVRVLSCSGSGTTSGVIAGVNWVANTTARPAVANMSLGGGASSSLDSAVNTAVSRGIVFAVAAGNSSANACNYSPARAASALTVGSTTSTDARSSFSNFGTCVDLFAPGSSITSAWHTSTTATNTISGTSMASPHVAGVAALYLQRNPGASASTVNSAIVGGATTGVVTSPGSGSPNRLLYSLI